MLLIGTLLSQKRLAPYLVFREKGPQGMQMCECHCEASSLEFQTLPFFFLSFFFFIRYGHNGRAEELVTKAAAQYLG